MIQVTNLNGLFNDPVFLCCFKCGSKNYMTFYADNHIFRLCSKCISKKDVVKHLKQLKLTWKPVEKERQP